MSVTPLGEHQKIVLQVSGLCYLLGNLSNNDTEDNAYQKINLYRTGSQFLQL